MDGGGYGVRGGRAYYRRVGKSGREPSALDLVAWGPKPRRGGRIWLWVFLVFATLVGLTTAIVTVVASVTLVTAQTDQDSYDRAPFCAIGAANTHDCVLRTTATVTFVDATKNTGKHAHGYTTDVGLDPDVGDWQAVTVSKSRDLTAQISTDDRWPVLVWRDEITRYTVLGATRDTDENPHHIVACHLATVAICLVLASLFGRPVLRRMAAAGIAVNRARNRIPDWTLAGIAAATIFAAILRLSWAVSALGLSGIAVLIGSAAVWPFVPWVRHPEPGTRLARGRRR
ncbi:MAG: hypothetical protein AUG49_08610 [Catenulispora sp. 13_1_20CM_3_70_7]|nr:MAG: hypothetical protein AUG49_08610 [Catenulispora sp. 13_1_20CM_3_70_7]